MKNMTFFVNQATGKYFLLDPVKLTLNAISNKDYWTLTKYKHLMGFTEETKFHYIPNYSTMKMFQKVLKSLDQTTLPEDLGTYLISEYPEPFI